MSQQMPFIHVLFLKSHFGKKYVFHVHVISGVTRDLSQGGGNFAEGSIGHRIGPTNQHSEKTLRNDSET